MCSALQKMAELAAAPPAEVENRSNIPMLQSTPRRDVHVLGPRKLVDDLPPTPPRHDSEESSSPAACIRSPRYEAFVMTGDKMLHINHKISPSYAKVRQDQLPPNTDVNRDVVKRGMFDDFPSVHKQRRLHKEYAAAIMSSCVQESRSQQILSTAGEESMPEAENGDSKEDSENKEMEPDWSSSMTINVEEMVSESVQESYDRQHPGDVHRSPNCMKEKQLCSGAEVPESSMVEAGQQNEEVDDSEGTEVADMGSTGANLDNDISRVDCEYWAKKMFVLDDFSPEKISRILLKSDPKAQMTEIEFMKLFNVGGVRVDAALRLFLEKVALTGESHQRATLLKKFSDRYNELNPDIFGSAEKVHALVCALILLNTDLHCQKDSKHMTSREFVNNLAHTEYKFECNLLKKLYNSVKDKPFITSYQTEKEAKAKMNPTVEEMAKLSSRIIEQQSMLFHPSNMLEFKSGWIMRKFQFDTDGKKTPFGRRGWKIMYASLRGLVLYLHKTDKESLDGTFATYNNCVLLHHAYAHVPMHYSKKQHVLSLRTADLGEILIQACNPSEMESWINCINYIVARYSTPALPSPVASKPELFYKPYLPKAPTKNSKPMQLRAHYEKVFEMEEKLQKIRSLAPPINARGKAVQDFFFKQRFVEYELERYQAYVKALEGKKPVPRRDTNGSPATSGFNSKPSEERKSYDRAMKD